MIDPADMHAVAAGRASTYALLAALYAAPPTAELMAQIRSGSLLTASGGPLGDAADALTASFRAAGAAGLPDAEIVAEHTRLFTLPSGVVPHESNYTDKNRRVGGHVTAAVKQFYDAAAAELTRACLELPDHVGVELEFMQFLCDLERQFWAEPDRDGLRRAVEFEADFLAGHLLLWHRELCERIQNETSLDIYRALANLTLEFLEAERVFVPELAAEIQSEWSTPCATES